MCLCGYCSLATQILICTDMHVNHMSQWSHGYANTAKLEQNKSFRLKTNINGNWSPHLLGRPRTYLRSTVQLLNNLLMAKTQYMIIYLRYKCYLKMGRCFKDLMSGNMIHCESVLHSFSSFAGEAERPHPYPLSVVVVFIKTTHVLLLD